MDSITLKIIFCVALLLLRIIVWRVMFDPVDPSSKYHFSYNDQVVSLIAIFMMADGTSSKSELMVVKKYLRTNYEERTALKMLKALRGRLKAYESTKYVQNDDLFAQIGRDLDYPQRLLLYVLFSRLVMVDDHTVQEVELLERFARLANIPYSDVLEVKKFYVKYAINNIGYIWALRMLNLKEGTSHKEAEARFNELREKSHPVQLIEMPYMERINRLSDYLNYNEAYYALMNPEIYKSDRKTSASNGGGEKRQSYYRKGREAKIDKDIIWALNILELSMENFSDEKIQAAFVKAMKQYPPSNYESADVKRRRREIEKAYRILMSKEKQWK